MVGMVSGDRLVCGSWQRVMECGHDVCLVLRG